jgi:hypothetical protein
MGRAARKYTMGALTAIAAVTIGMSVAPSAAADPSHCQTGPATTACGTNGGSSSTGASSAPAAPANHGGGCTNEYGGYQRC